MLLRSSPPPGTKQPCLTMMTSTASTNPLAEIEDLKERVVELEYFLYQTRNELTAEHVRQHISHIRNRIALLMKMAQN